MVDLLLILGIIMMIDVVVDGEMIDEVDGVMNVTMIVVLVAGEEGVMDIGMVHHEEE